MSVSRKSIWDALEARLATVPGWVTHSQRLRLHDQVPPSEQPAVFIQPGSQLANSTPGHPLRWTLSADVVVYVYEDTDTGPSGTLQGFLDAIEAALEAQPGEKSTGQRFNQNGYATTLGGLVSAVRISSIETDEGALGPQAVAVIAVEVETVA